MENFLQSIDIRNFNSIKQRSMKDCAPRLALTPERVARIGLTAKIKELISEYKIFTKETTVENVSTLLITTGRAEKTAKLSSSISTVLTNWVRDGLMVVSKKVGKINYYKF